MFKRLTFKRKMKMKKEHTELLDFTINPSFLELIKQPLENTKNSLYFSFDMERHGKLINCTIYNGKNGQVNISTKEKSCFGNTVIMKDYCKTPEDFKKMMERADELLTRFPK